MVIEKERIHKRNGSMANKKRQFDKQFKSDAIQYWKQHPDLTIQQIADSLGIGKSTFARWKSEYEHNNNEVQFKGSGNTSELEKENIRLRRELKNTEDALEILKKAIGILGE